MSMFWSLWFLLLLPDSSGASSSGNAVKLSVPVSVLLAFDLYRIDEFESTLSCPTKTIKSFTKFLVLIINPLLIILKEVFVDRFLAIGLPGRLKVRRVNWNVLGV